MIRTATLKDFPFIHQIAARPENTRFIVDVPDAELQDYLDLPDMDLVIWEVFGEPQGFALFCQLGNRANKTELRRLGLETTGKGQGQTFLAALIDYGFDQLDVNRIWLDVVHDNPRAQATYKRAGFTHEGTLRQDWMRPNGDVVDMVVFAMLKGERPG